MCSLSSLDLGVKLHVRGAGLGVIPGVELAGRWAEFGVLPRVKLGSWLGVLAESLGNVKLGE